MSRFFFADILARKLIIASDASQLQQRESLNSLNRSRSKADLRRTNRQNMFKNGSLPVVLSEEIIAKLLEDAHKCIEIEIDLPKQVVRRSNGEEYPFQVDEFRKHCLINGLDEISLTLEHEADIAAFEEKRSKVWPWLDGEVARPWCLVTSRC